MNEISTKTEKCRSWDIRKGKLTIAFKHGGGRLEIDVEDFYVNDNMLIVLYANGIKEYRPINNIYFVGFDNK